VDEFGKDVEKKTIASRLRGKGKAIPVQAVEALRVARV
jgi:hypothetical protein